MPIGVSELQHALPYLRPRGNGHLKAEHVGLSQGRQSTQPRVQRRDLASPSDTQEGALHAADTIHSIAEVMLSADRLGGYLRGQRGRREVEAGRLINDSEGRAQLQLRFLRVAENIVDKICGCGHVRLERGSKQSQSRVAHGSTIE